MKTSFGAEIYAKLQFRAVWELYRKNTAATKVSCRCIKFREIFIGLKFLFSAYHIVPKLSIHICAESKYLDLNQNLDLNIRI